VRLASQFCAPCPASGGRVFYETIGLLTFYEIIKDGPAAGEKINRRPVEIRGRIFPNFFRPDPRLCTV
jgi:hypothetical protein